LELKRPNTTLAPDPAADFYDLKAIYEKFADETKHSMATRKKWRPIIAAVAKDHSDIRNVTDLWCIEWKDRLLAKGLSARSIQFGYLAALRSTCAWAVTNKRLTSNPVDGIAVKVPKAKKERPKGYSDTEAHFILGLTLNQLTVDCRLSTGPPDNGCPGFAPVAPRTQPRKKSVSGSRHGSGMKGSPTNALRPTMPGGIGSRHYRGAISSMSMRATLCKAMPPP